MSNAQGARSTSQLALGRWALPTLAVAALIVLVAVFAQPGVPVPGAGLAIVLQIVIESGLIAATWIIGALGLGHLALRHGPSGSSWSLALACGIGIMLALAHLIGVLGGIGGGAGTILAWIPVAVGVGWLVLQTKREPEREPHWSREMRIPWTALLAIPGIAMMLVAACAPAGTLWASEAMGFDVLSYHLQLPREWLALGRISPLQHNAYSFLPSYMEATYAQLAAMSLGHDPSAGDGGPMQSAQLLHMLLAICAALLTARLIFSLADPSVDDPNVEANGKRRSMAALSAGLGASMVLLTPWTIVTASLAYNEMAVLVCLAGALLASFMPLLSPIWRGAIVGGLVGVACSAKLTSAYMVAPPVAIALLAMTPRRALVRTVFAGAIAGIIVMVPWLVRNAIASDGNPVFPFATTLLGSGHWTELEAARWSMGHHLSASIGDRLSLLFSGRGIGHPQWSIIPMLAPIVAATSLAPRATRRASAILLLGLVVQVAGWLFVGHLQSRFLLPALVPIAALFGLASSSMLSMQRTPMRVVCTGALIASQIWLVVSISVIFLHQNAGNPNLGLVGGAADLNGTLATAQLVRADAQSQQQILKSLAPPALANVLLAADRHPPPVRLYLLGESRPFYFQIPTLYHTTWDASPLGVRLREEQGDLDAAVRRLRSELGVTHLLINLDEMYRLHEVNRWYDPEVSVSLAVRLRDQYGLPIRAWTRAGALGTYLFELRVPEGLAR